MNFCSWMDGENFWRVNVTYIPGYSYCCVFATGGKFGEGMLYPLLDICIAGRTKRQNEECLLSSLFMHCCVFGRKDSMETRANANKGKLEDMSGVVEENDSSKGGKSGNGGDEKVEESDGSSGTKRTSYEIIGNDVYPNKKMRKELGYDQNGDDDCSYERRLCGIAGYAITDAIQMMKTVSMKFDAAECKCLVAWCIMFDDDKMLTAC